jgi:hypothetical protein
MFFFEYNSQAAFLQTYYYLKCLMSFYIIIVRPNHSGRTTVLYNKDSHLNFIHTKYKIFILVKGRQNEVLCDLQASSPPNYLRLISLVPFITYSY